MSANPDPELMRIFDFTADDLEANRAGQISERQGIHLKEANDADQFMLGCLTRFGLLIGGIFAFAFVVQPRQFGGTDSSRLIVLGIAIATLFWFTRSNIGSRKTDLQHRHAGKVEGAATWSVIGYGRDMTYQITVDGKAFRIEKQTYQAFESFMQFKNKYMIFRIYFVPEISQILSVEIITP